jgi:hypothetical protein
MSHAGIAVQQHPIDHGWAGSAALVAEATRVCRVGRIRCGLWQVSDTVRNGVCLSKRFSSANRISVDFCLFSVGPEKYA